jgi:hypothetical protein
MNDNRLTRYKGRNTLRKFSSVKRCRECGWAVVTQEGVGVRFSNGVSAFAASPLVAGSGFARYVILKLWLRAPLKLLRLFCGLNKTA